MNTNVILKIIVKLIIKNIASLQMKININVQIFFKIVQFVKYKIAQLFV